VLVLLHVLTRQTRVANLELQSAQPRGSSLSNIGTLVVSGRLYGYTHPAGGGTTAALSVDWGWDEKLLCKDEK